MTPSTERLEQIAAMFTKHDAELHRLVQRRGSRSTAIVDDACSFAWTQLLTSDHVDLGPPRWGALAWLTTVAVHQAWKLDRVERQAHEHIAKDIHEIDGFEHAAGASGHLMPSAEQIAEQHIRLELVKQLPERPRRFLLRLALGYSYDEIAEAEGASYTTVNKQIARAKRLLRQLEAQDAAGGE